MSHRHKAVRRCRADAILRDLPICFETISRMQQAVAQQALVAAPAPRRAFTRCARIAAESMRHSICVIGADVVPFRCC